jgi:nucleotide-binding universal stress UspA family protein
MFKTIFWATDGSENADRSLAYAKALAAGEGASLVALHVVQRITNSRATGLTANVDEGHVKEGVRKIVDELRAEGLDASLKVVDELGPQPAHLIADAARELDADVIVMGTRGHSAIGGLLLGSVTQRLLHVAPCPVLAVPPDTSATAAPTGGGVGAAAES